MSDTWILDPDLSSALKELDLQEIEDDLVDAQIHTLHMPHYAADGVARCRL